MGNVYSMDRETQQVSKRAEENLRRFSLSSFSSEIGSKIISQDWGERKYWKCKPRASLVAQMVKNPPAVSETWFQSLGWEDPLEEGMEIHPSTI